GARRAGAPLPPGSRRSVPAAAGATRLGAPAGAILRGMRNVRLVTLALVLGIAPSALVARPVVGADEPKLTQQEIEKIVHDYLLREPEVLAEALRLLQQRQSSAAAQKAKQAIRDHQQALLSDQSSPVEGNAQGKVTIVEFFDYRCVHCRRRS